MTFNISELVYCLSIFPLFFTVRVSNQLALKVYFFITGLIAIQLLRFKPRTSLCDMRNGVYFLFRGQRYNRGPGGVLPYMGYIGMCRCEGYGFQAVYSGIGYINQSVWV